MQVDVVPVTNRVTFTLEILKPYNSKDKNIMSKALKDLDLEYGKEKTNAYCKTKDVYTKNSTNKEIEEDEYLGIGWGLKTVEGEYPVVKSVKINGPADRAGISKGDKIWRIAGSGTYGKNENEIKLLLTGNRKAGDKVEILFFDASAVAPLVAQIFSAPVSSDVSPKHK